MQSGCIMAKEVIVQGLNVNYKIIGKEDYISITDIAKYFNSQDPSGVIRNWMSNKDSFEFYSLWEEINNPNFNSVEMRRIKIDEVGYKLVTEFQRLKAQEQKALEWSAKRELAKVNYRIHTDAIKENIVPTLTEAQLKFVYADEADLLNVALFGKTAAQWRKENPSLKGNIRDYATIEQLLVIANMESLNAYLIEQNIPQEERLKQLNNMARSQLRVLQESNSWLLEEGKDKQEKQWRIRYNYTYNNKSREFV